MTDTSEVPEQSSPNPPGPTEQDRPRPRGRRPGSPDTRAEILLAARAEFAAHGFEATSLRGVARVAGVDPALVHHYFEDKEDLFVHAAQLVVNPRDNLRTVLSVPTAHLGTTIIARLLTLWDSPLGQVTISELASNARLAHAFGTMLTRVARDLAATRFPRLSPHGRDQAILRVQAIMVGIMTARYIVKTEAFVTASHGELVRTFGPLVQQALDDAF